MVAQNQNRLKGITPLQRMYHQPYSSIRVSDPRELKRLQTPYLMGYQINFVFLLFARHNSNEFDSALAHASVVKPDAWKNGPAPKGWIDACDEGQAIYEDLLYEIPGLPVLLLLDKEHRVLMKNVYPGMVESFLMGK